MITFRFDNENDVSGTINALRCAAERFDDHAKMLRQDVNPPQERVAQQFDQQAAQARRIADEIELVC